VSNSRLQDQGLSLPKIGQIGIVVNDMDTSIQHYSKLLNLGSWFRSKTIEHEILFRGRKIILELDLLFAYSGGIQVELIDVK